MQTPRPSKLLLWCFVALSIAGTWWLSNNDVTQSVQWFTEQQGRSGAVALLVFAALATVSQLLVIPSGFLLLLLGGFVLGAWEATIIYAVIQLITLFPVTWLAKNNQLPTSVVQFAEQHVGRYTMVEKLNRLPLLIGVVLRLTPVIPSAVACLLSVWLQLPLRIFFVATLLVCWIRPLILSSIGERLPDLGRLLQLVN